MTNDESRVILNFVILLSFDIRFSSFTACDPASSFSSRDISRYADWPPRGSALARSFRDRSPPSRQLSSGCSSGTGTVARRGRTESARLNRNRADRSDNRAWRWPPRYRVLPLATCMREFLRRDRCRVLPGACKPERRFLPPGFAGALHAIDFHSRNGAKQTHL